MMKNNYIKADCRYTEKIFSLVQRTIREVYPKYYPREIVEFFRIYFYNLIQFGDTILNVLRQKRHFLRNVNFF